MRSKALMLLGTIAMLLTQAVVVTAMVGDLTTMVLILWSITALSVTALGLSLMDELKKRS